MATNATEMMTERRLAEDLFRLQHTKKSGENGTSEPEALVLAPLVDRIAYTIASGLVVAMKDLEDHIANETRKVGDAVGRRLDALQASFDELSGAVSEQRAVNASVQNKCEELAAADEALKEADARQVAETASLRSTFSERIAAAGAVWEQAGARHEAEIGELRATLSERIDGLCRELSVHQEDIVAVKGALGGFTKTVEGLVERLDRQADALRSMSAAYSQRETELEQLVDSLARLRAYPAPAPLDRL